MSYYHNIEVNSGGLRACIIDSYIAIPVDITNVSSAKAELRNINLVVRENGRNNARKIFYYTTERVKESSTLIATYEYEMFLEQIHLPIAIEPQTRIEGYLLFECRGLVKQTQNAILFMQLLTTIV